MSPLTKLFWILLTTAMSFALTTPLFAGLIPTATPSATPTATPTPTATATPTPTATATATPTATPTPTAIDTCTFANPLTTILTLGKQDAKKTPETAADNATLIHIISGFIVDAGSLSITADKIKVCEGTNVDVVFTDSSGMPQRVKPTGRNISCFLNATGGGCTVTTIRGARSYEVKSFDGTDNDKIQIKSKK